MNCIIFTSKTPQILTVQFRLLRNWTVKIHERNSWIFR